MTDYENVRESAEEIEKVHGHIFARSPVLDRIIVRRRKEDPAHLDVTCVICGHSLCPLCGTTVDCLKAECADG